ncbi:MAG: glycosyltransferase family 2 protein [Waterburya sp.]
MPKVSIIIPTYNSEDTIEETIASIQQQSFTNWELIIIDDGSQDNTVDIVKNIVEPRLKLFVYENGGVGMARNRGIAQATGEFITFLDADDLWTCDKLALQIEALNQNPQAKVAYSWTSFIDENGKFLFSGKTLYYQGNVYKHLLLTNFLLSGSNILIHRDVLQVVIGFNPDLPYVADWNFYLRLAKNFDFAVVPKYQILYRQSANSMSSKIEEIKQESLQIINEAFQSAPAKLNLLKKRSYSILYLYCADLYRKKINIEDRQSLVNAKENLKTSILLYPQSLLEISTLRILIKIIVWELFFMIPTGYLTQLSRKNNI